MGSYTRLHCDRCSSDLDVDTTEHHLPTEYVQLRIDSGAVEEILLGQLKAGTAYKRVVVDEATAAEVGGKRIDRKDGPPIWLVFLCGQCQRTIAAAADLARREAMKARP